MAPTATVAKASGWKIEQVKIRVYVCVYLFVCALECMCMCVCVCVCAHVGEGSVGAPTKLPYKLWGFI